MQRTSRISFGFCVLVGLLSTGFGECIIGPFDESSFSGQEVEFRGYTPDPTSPIEIQVWADGTWVTVDFVTPSGDSLAAGLWPGSPQLFEWTADVDIIPGFFDPYAQRTVRVRAIQNGNQFAEFHTWSEIFCVWNEQGQTNLFVAYQDCTTGKDFELELDHPPEPMDVVTFSSIYIVDQSVAAPGNSPGADIDAVWRWNRSNSAVTYASAVLSSITGPEGSGNADQPAGMLGPPDYQCGTPYTPTSFYAMGGNPGYVELDLGSPSSPVTSGDIVVVRELGAPIGLPCLWDYDPVEIWGEEAGTGQLYFIGATEDPETILNSQLDPSISDWEEGWAIQVNGRNYLTPGYLYPFGDYVYFIKQ